MDEKDYREIKRDIESLKNKIEELYNSLGIDKKKEKLEFFEKLTIDEGFWQDVEKATIVNQEISSLKKQIEPWVEFRIEISESIDLMEMALAEMDDEILQEISGTLKEYEERFEKLETIELLSGTDDEKNAYISVHPGAGGTESQDWASMLFRMYLRWAEKHDCSVEVIDYTPGEEAGIKTATALISGDNVFGLMKGERGIHRLVRISPFDANKRRHTSFAAVDVIPEIPEDIEVEINESDLRIDTYRASGAGGQHVNKTDSAVRITHIPSGIVVQCQNERSQHKNKAFAMKMLKSKLYELKQKENEEKMMEKSGDKKDISWGNQIRSYVFQPYTLVKDHRTNEEMGSIEYVLDGDIDKFIYAYLKAFKGNI